jgi:diacylglycerol O-acyltransferase
MHQLTGLDASYLHMEDARATGHVGALIVVDPSTSDRPITADTIRQHIADRIHLLAPFRWKLVTVPFGIDLPYWIDDPGLDLDYHVREGALPRPGTDSQLAQLVARISSRPLDRAHPLWEYYVIEGLPDGRVGILSKTHHAAVDGKSGMKILTTLLSEDPRSSPPPAPTVSSADPEPSEYDMWVRGWTGIMTRPEKAQRLMADLAKEGERLAASHYGLDALKPMNRSRPDTSDAPRLPFNRMLTARRNWAFGTLSLTDAKKVRARYGCTINDVVMAICAGALRRWLKSHDALPDRPIKAMVPISTRTAEDAEASVSGGNQVSGMVADLPTHIAEPGARLKAAHQIMRAAKEKHSALPASLLQQFSQFTAPAAAELVARTAAELRLAEVFDLPFNLVISNVPGPREPLYYAGALLEANYPVSMLAHGMGLNITVQSYRDRMDFGLVSCPELVPDLWSLVDYLGEAMEELVAL